MEQSQPPLKRPPPGRGVFVTGSVVFVCRSRRKTSYSLSLAPGTRSRPVEQKTTQRPSALIAPQPESEVNPGSVASAPAELTLMRSVVPLVLSRTKTSGALFVSLFTRFDARELKTTNLPSALRFLPVPSKVIGPMSSIVVL